MANKQIPEGVALNGSARAVEPVETVEEAMDLEPLHEIRHHPPSVAGDYCTTSIWEFENKCLVCLDVEKSKAFPDSAILGLLCDAVRLGRELAKSKPVLASDSRLDLVQQYCQQQKEANALASPGIILNMLSGSARVVEDVETVVPSFLIADAEVLAAEPPELFYIQNTVFVEDCILWWTQGGDGYTCDLKKAWKVDLETANRLAKENPKYAKAWPVALVDRCAQLHVTEESLKDASDA